jgi:phosphoenolpyruvate-protein kinase (PTS system EI component)
VPGEVAVLEHPHPRFAPVLWTAAAVVTEAGSAAAHLMEVARSLRVPALCAAPPLQLGPDRSPGQRCLLCVDGDNGVLTLLQSVAYSGWR